LYLNQIFLGQGAYGVAGAARRYFDKTLSELDLGEMATLAGLAPAPSRVSPLARVEAARAPRAQGPAAQVGSHCPTRARAAPPRAPPRPPPPPPPGPPRRRPAGPRPAATARSACSRAACRWRPRWSPGST